MTSMLRVLALFGLASVALISIVPAASAHDECPPAPFWCNHGDQGNAAVCASHVGCIKWCSLGGGSDCVESHCYRLIDSFDTVQVCVDATLAP